MDEREISKGASKPLLKEIEELKKFKEEITKGKIKKKKLKIPRKAKIRKGKMKKGYIGVLKIDENRNITAEKAKLMGSAFNTKDGLYHATDGKELFFWEGKHPVLIQPSWKNNPLKIDPEKEKNETYGQPYIKAKMLADTIKVKKRGGNIIVWILIAGAVLFGINYFMGGGLFG